MCLREQSAIQEANAGEPQPAFPFTREQFLRDRVAVVVRQHVRLLDPMLLQQRLAEVGLQARWHTCALRGLDESPKPSKSSAYKE